MTNTIDKVALDRVRESRARLAIQGDQLGIRSRGRRERDPDDMSPMRERIAHAAGLIDAPEVNQARSRRAWRLVPLVEAMHRDNKISDDCLKAYARFEHDWAVANRTSSGIGSYGERINSTRDGDGIGELRKAAAHRRIETAQQSIGSPHGRKALVMAVTSKHETSLPHTLEDIGRACSTCANRAQAVAAGMATLRDALYQLHQHYDEG
jgi:hypothetical protein